MSSASAGPVTTAITDGAARVVIDRPAARNALSPDVVAQLSAAITAAESAGCAVLVIRGAGGTLSAGADLKYLRSVLGDEAAVREYITAIGAMVNQLARAPFVTVAVVEQYALAGGCEILLACDLAVVSEQALIGDRHLNYGLLPGAGGSVRLARALPPALARRLLYTGEMIDGAAAARAGLVSHAVPAAQVESELDALVGRLTALSRPALVQMKRLYEAAVTIDHAQALEHERETLLRHLAKEADAAEGLAAFAERRAPDWSRP